MIELLVYISLVLLGCSAMCAIILWFFCVPTYIADIVKELKRMNDLKENNNA